MMKRISIRKISIALFCGICLTSCLKQNPDNPPVVTPPTDSNTVVTYDWNKIADSAQTSMNLFWSPSDKYYLKSNTATDWTQYWPNAHALDIAVDGYLRTASANFKTRMSDLLTGVYAKNGNTWINYYYDDMEWMRPC